VTDGSKWIWCMPPKCAPPCPTQHRCSVLSFGVIVNLYKSSDLAPQPAGTAWGGNMGFQYSWFPLLPRNQPELLRLRFRSAKANSVAHGIRLSTFWESVNFLSNPPQLALDCRFEALCRPATHEMFMPSHMSILTQYACIS
jgi:hypothetical protein